MFYFAYGSNLWRQQMLSRCPEQAVIGLGCIKGWRWIITIRGYASIVRSEFDYVLGTVYELSETDVKNLDRYEGVSRGDYYKEMIEVCVNGRVMECLVYIDPVVEEGNPKKEYIARINDGIRDAVLGDEYIVRYLRPFIPEDIQ